MLPGRATWPSPVFPPRAAGRWTERVPAWLRVCLPAAILLLGSIFVGTAHSIGLDTVQLGIMMVINLAIGIYTPPVGTTLFISATIAQTTIGRVVPELLPFYVVALMVLLLMSYITTLTFIFL